MKKILFPTDFSDNASEALDYLMDMHKGESIDLKIINAVDAQGFVIDDAAASIQILDQLIKQAGVSTKAIKQKVEAFKETNFEDWKIGTEVVVGSPISKIVELANDFEADLIVMGNKGVNYSISDSLLGLTAFLLTKKASCPVMLVPKGYKFVPIVNVLFPTNLEYSDPYILWKGINAISPFQPIVHCLHIKLDNEESALGEEFQFAKFMTEHSPSIQTIYKTENGSKKEVVGMLSNYVDNHDCSMIIMHKSEKSFFEKLTSKSITKGMRKNINVPLLVMRGVEK